MPLKIHWEIFIKITEFVKNKDIDGARKLQTEYKELIDSLYAESNPIPVKKGLELMGILECSALRLPLLEASQATVEKLKRTLGQKGLVK